MIVPSTKEHFELLYSSNPPLTMRGFSIVDGDEVLGMAGIYNSYGNFVAFVNIDKKLKSRKKELVLLSRKVLPLFKGKKVYASRDSDLSTSKGLLEHFDFSPVEGDVWLRQSHS